MEKISVRSIGFNRVGESQKEVGHRVSQKLDTIVYKGFTEEEIRQFEAFKKEFWLI